jgi:tetrahydromethanopterin S-methyltransferase subunit G
MLKWWRRRRERQQQVVRDADNLEALFGHRAYSEAIARARLEEEEGRDAQHWLAVRQEIARRIGKDIGLDTATKYQSDWDRQSMVTLIL